LKRIARMSAEELAARVCQALHDAGITVTLTGGACVAIWSNGAYESQDLDFVEQGLVPRREIRQVLRKLGFVESRRYFTHPESEFLIEFPSGPLAVGDQLVSDYAERTLPTGTLRLLTPTDCVKDRLAAWFHWNDRQALEQACLVTRAQRIDSGDLKRWARREGHDEAFRKFLRKLTE
jgi:hypothetical protein